MASFRNDYCYLAHPRILEALAKYQDENQGAYGLDIHSAKAAEYLKQTFGSKEGEVYFLAGGTQTNMTFISYCLRPYEGVISCDSGHINVHETAAIEGSGHKIIVVPNHNGKLTAEDIYAVHQAYQDEHMVKPGMVYISDSTEIGTIYKKQELIDLYKACQDCGYVFFIDGARLGSALTCKENDIEPAEFGSLCDAFYVGGTKNGFLYGEALVINNKALQKDFRYHIKNKGAMLAKGFVVGMEFEEMFRDGLYFDLAKTTNEVASSLRKVFAKYGLKMAPSPTNQIFVTLGKDKANALLKEFSLEKWNEVGEEMTVRFVTCFKTTKKDIQEVDVFLAKLMK